MILLKYTTDFLYLNLKKKCNIIAQLHELNNNEEHHDMMPSRVISLTFNN